MKEILYITSLVLLVSAATAVVGGPEPGEGEMAITSSGSSASASTAVDENGTQWRAEVSMTNRSQADVEDTVSDVEFSDGGLGKKAEFNGAIVAPTPCHVLDHEVNQTGEDSYVLNVKTVKDELEDMACTQVLTGIKYSGSFSTDSDFQLEVRHNGETVDTLTSPDYTEPGRGFLSSIIGWFRNLF